MIKTSTKYTSNNRRDNDGEKEEDGRKLKRNACYDLNPWRNHYFNMGLLLQPIYGSFLKTLNVKGVENNAST